MAVQRFEKQNYDAIEFSADGWGEPTTDADGARTYTSTSDTSSLVVKFRPPRAEQTHGVCKTGSKVTRHKDGSVTIEQRT